MLNRMAKKAADNFIRKGMIEPENRVIYEYGIKQGVILLINITTMILIGVISGYFIISAVFMLVYIPLRTYAGGYHAPNPISCYIISVLMAMGAIYLTVYLSSNMTRMSVIWGLPFALVLYALSPIEAPGKSLSRRQKQVYRKRTALILLALSFLCILNCFIQIVYVSEAIIVAVTFVCIAGIAGYVRGKAQYNR